MAVFKCKMCGGALEVTEGMSVCECEYCGTKQTLPKMDNDRTVNLYDRANHFRRNNDFDKAMSIYEQILNDNTEDAESYWSIVLCRYGIEYVEDPATHKRLPTVNRAQFTSIYADEDYRSAIKYADPFQREVYEAEAKAIDEIQKGILDISSKEKPFDVFICYKETDSNGRRTPDSVLANDLYHQLTNEGFKVFFSRITLEDKLGSAYDPYIFAALNSAKVMVVLGTRPEYFNAVWVKNEWSRYLALIRSGAKKVLIPAYRDMDPYDLPEEFSHLQAQDMSKLGFMQDLIRGIKKLTAAAAPQPAPQKPAEVIPTSASTAPLLRRVFIYLEDGDWTSADEYCEKVLDLEPENPRAYLGKLMAELRVSKQENLKDCPRPFDGSKNYQKIMRYADEPLKAELTADISSINERNETARKENIYTAANTILQTSEDIEKLSSARDSFLSIKEYKDSAELAEQCYKKRCQIIYDEAVAVLNRNNSSQDELTIAGDKFMSIPDFKDSVPLANRCHDRICQIIYDEAIMILSDRKSIHTDIEKAKKAFLSILDYKDSAQCVKKCDDRIQELKNNFRYGKARAALSDAKKMYRDGLEDKDTETVQDAIELLEEGKTRFQKLKNFRDSNARAEECDTLIAEYKETFVQIEKDLEEERLLAERTALIKKKRRKRAVIISLISVVTIAAAICVTVFVIIPSIKYNNAMQLYENGDYAQAAQAFKELNGYKDSEGQIIKCETAIIDRNYNNALELYNAGKLDEAYDAFFELNGYKDSSDKTAEIIAKSASKSTKNSTYISVSGHTVGLKKDGTVVAVGYNGDGQCDVSGWKDIIAVSAGYYHTVGLKKDGTVVAAGRNDSGQCDVSGWKDIIAVSAGEGHTIGLKADGTVVAVGNNSDGKCNVDGWKLKVE